jgi:hypothetical protein
MKAYFSFPSAINSLSLRERVGVRSKLTKKQIEVTMFAAGRNDMRALQNMFLAENEP